MTNDHRHALIFNAVTKGIADADRFVALNEREHIARLVGQALDNAAANQLLTTPKLAADLRERIYEAGRRQLAKHCGLGLSLPDLWAAAEPELTRLQQRVKQAETAIERARALADEALRAWEPEHEYHRERAERKGYSHDEARAETYGLAIKAVTEILAAFDQPAKEER